MRNINVEKIYEYPETAIVIAALNEEEGIGPTLKEIESTVNDPFLLVVDGNSVDRTASIAKELGSEVLLQDRDTAGKGSAIAQALNHIDRDMQYIVFIDADYTYPAENIPKMIKILEENPDVGMVIGNRFDTKFNFRKAINSRLFFGNRLIAFAQNLLNGVKLCDPLSGLRVVRGNLLRNWNPKSKHFDIEVEMNYYIEKTGYKIREIPIQYRHRLGEKKLKLRDGFPILKRIVIESFS
ncbi:MAG: glycosyltransferase family 2 protein [Candidatus Hodarchaeota archaeon]